MGQNGLKHVVLMCVLLMKVIQGSDLAAHMSTNGVISYEPRLLSLQG